MIRSLYLAGPDVFRPDAHVRGLELKALYAQFGIEGLFPLDQDVPAHIAEPGEQAAWIYRANIGLIERADTVLANLDFFRGLTGQQYLLRSRLRGARSSACH